MADKNEGGGNKLVMVLLIFNMLSIAGVAGLLGFQHYEQKNKETLEDIVMGQAEGRNVAATDDGTVPETGLAALPDLEPEEVRIFELETFTANLNNPRAVKYVRIRVELEMDKSLSEQEVERKKPQIRDEVLSILNSKRDSELLTLAGKNYLKAEIKNSVNNFLQTGKIKKILFTDFLIN